MTCLICNVALTGRLDTYGPLDGEMCWDCWSDGGEIPRGTEWYGQAPSSDTLARLEPIETEEPGHPPIYDLGTATFQPDPCDAMFGTYTSTGVRP